jgi:hypothetical protein
MGRQRTWRGPISATASDVKPRQSGRRTAAPAWLPTTPAPGDAAAGRAREYADTRLVQLADRSIFVVRDLKTLRIDPVALGIEVVVSGHSHVPKIDVVGGVLYLNSGSAGRRCFRLPITLATLDISRDALRPAIHDLG